MRPNYDDRYFPNRDERFRGRIPPRPSLISFRVRLLLAIFGENPARRALLARIPQRPRVPPLRPYGMWRSARRKAGAAPREGAAGE